jgi:hypothetical protein
MNPAFSNARNDLRLISSGSAIAALILGSAEGDFHEKAAERSGSEPQPDHRLVPDDQVDASGTRLGLKRRARENRARQTRLKSGRGLVS